MRTPTTAPMLARALVVSAAALIAACGARGERRAARRDAGADAAPPAVILPTEPPTERGLVTIELAEVAALMPPFDFLILREELHHARRVQRLEARYCATEPTAATVPRVTAALVERGWIASRPRRAPRPDDLRIAASHDRLRILVAVLPAGPGDCEGAAMTQVRVSVRKAADGR